MDSLRTLAGELGVPERTLRRAGSEGLIHGVRVGPRRFRTTVGEQLYLRSHWPLLRSLRQALRTEPNVQLAVLFGSTARGDDGARSDIDVLVELADSGVSRLAALTERLSARTGRDVQALRLRDAERSPLLMADALEQGRVLVDRQGRWPALLSQGERWRRLAASEGRWRLEPMDDLLVGATVS